ncbi:MAG: penicillin acylase family protein, partial [Verrucomicrobia bacterium]|nr:penicillin acylase family protein [Verrucomicrobiota bacterium]
MPTAAPRFQRFARLLVFCALGLCDLLLLAVGAFYLRWRASLPQTHGTRILFGLTAPVTVARDALGVPTIHGGSRLDVARALGFVHAQERFFQMDLLRR